MATENTYLSNEESIMNSKSKCYFCGGLTSSRDHVPPKCIFPEPRTPDLITVPSCDKHNMEYSKDDEYFQWFITTASSYSSSAMKIIDKKVVKAFRRNPAYYRKIMSNLIKVDIVTKSGLYIKTTNAFKYDTNRIKQIVEKIIRGLYYHEKKYETIFPKDYHVRKFYLMYPPMDKDFVNMIESSPGQLIANGDFWYKYRYVTEANYLMSWFLMFYHKTLIMAITDNIANPVWKMSD